MITKATAEDAGELEKIITPEFSYRKFTAEQIKKRIEKIILLVKKENAVAKKLYKLNGFKFTKLHNKKIENSIIEVWEKTLTYFN